VITTDETGYIISGSGSADCAQPSCVIPIQGTYTETFTAVAAEGYRFVEWSGICANAPTKVCEIKLADLPDQHHEMEQDVELAAVFESSTVQRAWYRDSDEDSYGTQLDSVMAFEQPDGFVTNNADCDDSRDSINPRAKEIEDWADNDCDGLVDEGRIYYRDVDGDGFGTADDVIESFGPVDGYAAFSKDCDDNNESIFPFAQEELDSVDNDCDGLVDEDFVARMYSRDIDGDGFGDAADTVQAFNKPDGYVVNANDNCIGISNPAQTDTDNDGIGDACDSVDDSDTPTKVAPLPKIRPTAGICH